MKRDLYTRPAKPFTVFGARRRPSRDVLKPDTLAQPVAVDRFTECHVTPADVAARMVDYLDAGPDQFTLEPSAGTGNLAAALMAAGHSSCELCLVERHTKLYFGLRDGRFPGAGFVNECFLEWSMKNGGEGFSRIIMNPPFRQVRQHIAAAERLLKRGAYPDARLIALVPVTFKHATAETLEYLGPDTFAAAKVNTKIIEIEA